MPGTRQSERSQGDSPASSAGNKNDWLNIADKTQRKRVQNRLAQQNYRKKMKQRIEELEHQAQVTSRLPLQDTDAAAHNPNNASGAHVVCHGACCKARARGFHACHDYHHSDAVWPHADDRPILPPAGNLASLDTSFTSLDHPGAHSSGSRHLGLMTSLDFAAPFLDDGWLKQLPSAPIAGAGMDPGSMTETNEGFGPHGGAIANLASPVSPADSLPAVAAPTHPLGQGYHPPLPRPGKTPSLFDSEQSRPPDGTSHPTPTSPGQQESLAEKLSYMTRCAKQAGFDSLESVFSAYFFDTEADKTSHILASSRRLSRNRELPGILADLRANIGKWSAWEARGCVNELLRCAETILGAEVKDFARDADVQALLGKLVQIRRSSIDHSDAAAASLPYSSPVSVPGAAQAQASAAVAAQQEEVIYKVSQLLQDKMPNLWAMIMSLSENCVDGQDGRDHHVVLAALSLLCLSGSVPVEKLVDACLSPS